MSALIARMSKSNADWPMIAIYTAISIGFVAYVCRFDILRFVGSHFS